MRVDLRSLSCFTFCDPAGKRKAQALKKVKARTAIVTIGVDLLERIFVLDAWADKSTTQRVADRIFTTAERYLPRKFGIESNAMQELFADMLYLDAKRRGVSVPFIEVHQPTNVDKHWRIRSVLQPRIARGQLFLMKDQHELRTELTSFPLGATVDLVDALASAVALAPLRRPQVVQNEERDALAAYLRRSGCALDFITARLRRYDQEHGGGAAA